MINVCIDSLFRFYFITEKNVKFYGKSISGLRFVYVSKITLDTLEVPGSRMRVSFFTGGGGSLYLRQLGETNGQHLRVSARMRCHSPSTKHTGGLRLFSREFPESELFWLKRSFQNLRD